MEIYDWPFPEDLYGQVIEGIDLAILSADSLRIMAAFAQQDKLSDIQLKFFKQCCEELQEICDSEHLEGYGRDFFEKLKGEVEKNYKAVIRQ